MTMKPKTMKPQVKYMKGTEKYDIRSPEELIDFGMSVIDAISYFNIFQYYKTSKVVCAQQSLDHEYDMDQQSIVLKSIIQQVIKNKVEHQVVNKGWVIRKWENDY